MADVMDVLFRLETDINNVVQPLVGQVYPIPQSVLNYIDQATFGNQTINSIQVMIGDPLLRTIMQRLELGKGQIGVFADEHEIKTQQYIDLPNYLPVGQQAQVPALSIATSNNGTVCTISGTIQSGDVIGCTLGQNGASYAVQPTDSLTTIATQLAANCNTANIMASSSGAVVTILSVGEPLFSVGTSWSVDQEIWRRRKIFCADYHAPTPYDMQFVGRYIEQMYPPATRLTLDDGTYATVLSMDTIDFAEQQRDGAYLRRFRWLIDFVTSLQSPVTQIVAVADSVTSDLIGTVLSNTPPTSSQL